MVSTIPSSHYLGCCIHRGVCVAKYVIDFVNSPYGVRSQWLEATTEARKVEYTSLSFEQSSSGFWTVLILDYEQSIVELQWKKAFVGHSYKL